jgi:hypothetical protein
MRIGPPVTVLASALTATLALVACNGGGFGSNFEGDVTMKTTRPNGPPSSMTIKAKGDKIRLEMPTPDGKVASAIYMPQDNKLVVLLDAQKTAMDMNFASPNAPQPNTNAQTSAIDKTGKKETIAGIGCEDWIIKDPSGSRTETCVAEGLPYLDLDGLRHGGAGSSPWKAEMRAKKTFPLRSVEYDKSGKELTRAEVTEVKKEKLDDSEFVVPADYAHVPMGQPIGQVGAH